ncbi:hypothetical protein J4422_04430 [Candidatus Pacearchaeota archaeon]|nr:hypothetical protein [Candidatus Pacearchaeota archaeon]
MPQITIDIDDKVHKVLSARAKKNLMTIREQAEDIIRRSAANFKKSTPEDKIDDTLVSVFSRNKKGRRK